MKSKSLSLFALSILSLVFLMSFASADINFIPTTITQTVFVDKTVTVSFQLDNTNLTENATNLIYEVPVILNLGLNTLSSADSITGKVSSLNNATKSTAMSLTFSVPKNQDLGIYTGNLSLTGDYAGGIFDSLPISITVTAPKEVLDCSATSNPGDLNVRKIDFKNNGFSHNEFGKDDEWFPFDEIEVEIEIENDGDYDVDDIEVSWGIYALDREEWLIDFDNEDEFNLKNGKEETLMISFKLDDDLDIDFEDFSDDTDNYRFYVVADGVIDDKDSLNDEEDTCAFDYEPASIVIENDFVVLDNIDFPETVRCGETVQVTADVWNIEDDQDEVSVFVSNKELDLRKDIMVGDIDEFDNAELSFSFEVPKNAEEKTYAILFEVFDENGDIYENDDDDNSEFRVPFRVEGNCGAAVDEVSISASLQSGGKAGQDLVVRATITNNGDELETFTINAAGFTQWASSYTADKTSLVLGAGDSADVLFTFDVNKDASGSQSFTIELVSEDNQVTTQPVSVAIEGRSGIFGFTGGVISGNNAYLWGIGALNIILVVIIIIVAVRVARR